MNDSREQRCNKGLQNTVAGLPIRDQRFVGCRLAGEGEGGPEAQPPGTPRVCSMGERHQVSRRRLRNDEEQQVCCQLIVVSDHERYIGEGEPEMIDPDLRDLIDGQAA